MGLTSACRAPQHCTVYLWLSPEKEFDCSSLQQVKDIEICLDPLVTRIIHVTKELLCLLLRDISPLTVSELHIPEIPNE